MPDLVAVTVEDVGREAAIALLEPDKFAEYYLKTDLWNTQRAILRLVKNHRQVAVKACHASSKTFSAARALLWFLARYNDVTVVTTAPTWGQVEKLLWGEVHSALRQSRYPFPKPLKTELEIKTEGSRKRLAYGLSTSVTNQDEGVKFQGIHAENVLFILDEAPGVDPKIWQAIEGGRAGGNTRVLAIGNPTISSGPFHDCFTKNRAAWECVTINAFSTPNFVDIPYESKDENGNELTGIDILDGGKVRQGSKLFNLLNMSNEELDSNPRPYIITRRWVYEMYHAYGIGHPMWDTRVLGEFPKQDEFSLLSLSWLEAAKIRDLKGLGKISIGIDVAGPGEAETSLTARIGPQIILHKQWPIADPRGEIMNILNQYRGNIEAVNVDAVGIGYYIYCDIKEKKFPAVPIIAQSTSSDSEKFHTSKDEFYWGFRKRCEDGDISGLDDETTIGQLSSIRYKHNSRGQIEIESKSDAAKRGVPSPDRAESVILAFAQRLICYGVLDAQREEKAEMQKLQSSRLMKPATSDKQLSCTVCKATCIAPAQGMMRCNNCGHQWTTREAAPGQPQSRKDVLMKMESERNKL